jgi:Mrp family chromosome partitioning ATPase
VLVLEAERTRRSAALRVKKQLEHLGANILGIALNKRRHHVPGWLYRTF